MKQQYLFLMSFAGLVLITIVSAFYSVNNQISETAYAQNPNITGCWNRVDALPKPCSCEGGFTDGSVDSAENGEGSGAQGITQATQTCETSNENGPLSCQVSVGRPQYNSFCATPTPTPPPTFPNCNMTNIGRCTNSAEEFCSCQASGRQWFEQTCQCATPTPTPEPTPEPTPTPEGYEGLEYVAGGGYSCQLCEDAGDNDYNGQIDLADGGCQNCIPSPIVIDTLGNGFQMSNAANGVMFDISACGRQRRISWT